MKNLKFLLTILFCSLFQISFCQSWLTSGNGDITDNSFIGSNSNNDKDIVFKRGGVVGLTLTKGNWTVPPQFRPFFQNRTTIPLSYVHIPRVQIGGELGAMKDLPGLVTTYIVGQTSIDGALSAKTSVSTDRLFVNGIATVEFLEVEGKYGQALIRINQTDDTRGWTGLTYRRKGAEKWFSGIMANSDDFVIRRNANDNDFVINSEGRVKIGNRPLAATSPYIGSYKLAVDGTIISTQTVVTQQNWADDEFEKESPLLNDEKEFALKNNHLLGIPSQKEIIEKGLDLGEMQAMQIRKIEQLYKHMWEQQEMIEKLTKQNTVLSEQIKSIQNTIK